MKKTIKAVLAKSLAVAMAFSLVGIASGADAEAAAKPSVTKKVSVKVGKTKKVKVTSKKAIKKTKWTLNKAGKKVVKLSKATKKNVTVKGKKAGKGKLTAKVTVGKKTYSLTTNITVTKNNNPKPPVKTDAAEPTQTPVGTPSVSGEPAPSQEPANDPLPIGITGKKYLPSESWDIPITELNETSMTSDLKRTEDPETRSDVIFDKNGVTFTAPKDYNNGVSFYVNPCTSESDLEVTGRGEGNVGYRKAEKDITEYDYIHVKVTSEGELNSRLYNGYKVEDGDAGWTGEDLAVYEGSWAGPAAQDDYMLPSDGGAGRLMMEGFAERDVFIPIDSLVSNLNPEALTMIVIGLQREGMEATIHKLELVKVMKEVPVTAITVAAASTEVTEGKSGSCTATVTPDNASRSRVVWSSSDEKIATVNKYTGQVKGVSVGTVTITASATDGSGVTGAVELKVVSPSGTAIETHKVDLKAETVVAQTNPGAGDFVAAEKTDAGIKFGDAGSMIIVNLKDYIAANGLDLTNYSTLDVEWEVQDAEGKVVPALAEAISWGKVAWVSDGNLNGYTDGANVDLGGTTVLSQTSSLPVADHADALAAAIGFNIQVPSDAVANGRFVIKSITFTA